MLKERAGVFRNQEKEKNATHPLAPGKKEGIKYVSFDPILVANFLCVQQFIANRKKIRSSDLKTTILKLDIFEKRLLNFFSVFLPLMA